MGVAAFIRSLLGGEGVLASGYPDLPREITLPPAPAARRDPLRDECPSEIVRYAGRMRVPTAMVVSSARLERRGDHDHVSIWSRGGHAGELCLRAGDGHLLLSWLGLRREPVVTEAAPVVIFEDTE